MTGAALADVASTYRGLALDNARRMNFPGIAWADLARERALDELAIEHATWNREDRNAAQAVRLYAYRIETEL